jgi:hypothetical protein
MLVAVQDAVPKKSVGPEHDIDGADGVPVPSGSFHAHFSRSASGSAGAVASRHPPTTSSTPHTLHRLLCRISTPLDRVSGVVPRVADRRAPDVVRSASGAGVRRTQSGTNGEGASPERGENVGFCGTQHPMPDRNPDASMAIVSRYAPDRMVRTSRSEWRGSACRWRRSRR